MVAINKDFTDKKAKFKKDELLASPVERWVRVGDGLPEEGRLVRVQCSDCMGDFFGKAMRKSYKKPPKGKSAKGFRKGKGWRWLDARGEVFDGVVETWAETTP